VVREPRVNAGQSGDALGGGAQLPGRRDIRLTGDRDHSHARSSEDLDETPWFAGRVVAAIVSAYNR